MPRPSRLASISTEDLVEELRRRFAAIEKAKALLLGNGVSRTPVHQPGQRKRGGTSEYARKISSLVQTRRHAKNKGDKHKVAELDAELKRLRAQHKG